MSRLPARGLLLVLFVGMVFATPRSAEPPTPDRAISRPVQVPDACLQADAHATLSWSGTQVRAHHQGSATSYTGTACGRYVVDVDVSPLQPISGYGTSFVVESMPGSTPSPQEIIRNFTQQQCESLVIDINYYRKPPRVRAMTKFAGGRRRGVWHPEQPSFKCLVENAPGFVDVPWQTTGPSGATRYRTATSARYGNTVLPVYVSSRRQPGPILRPGSR